jgi:Ca-activated chloride channel homolog
MEDEFDYMVTPLVFNVSLKLQSQGWRIDDVFGSPQADESTGELMRIDTLFPAKSVGGEVKGGLVLLKLRKTSSQNNQPIYLDVTYEDRNGHRDGDQAAIYMESYHPEYFDNTGIRKGILLVRYASLLKNWAADEIEYRQYSSWEPCINENTGIAIPNESRYGQWERTSTALTCSQEYKYLIDKFDKYFINEMNAIGDDSLSQELTIMNRIA